MTNLENQLPPKLLIAFCILLYILLAPAIAFAVDDADSEEPTCDISEITSSDTSLEGSSDNPEITVQETGDSETGTVTEISSSEPVDDFESEEPAAYSNETPVLEPSFENSFDDPELIDKEIVVSEIEPDAGGGDCYVAEITPDVVVDDDTGSYTDGEGNDIPNAGDQGAFTVTFTELGDQTIGSARVDIPSGFTSIDYDTDWTTSGISTNNGQTWQGKLDGMFIYLRALDDTQFLSNGDHVSVTFTATTPDTTGVYEFSTRAWTGITADFTAAGTNNMAEGFSDPRVIVGLPVNSTHDLDSIRDNLTEHYIQVDNIDLGVDPYNTDAGWEPIGANIAGKIFSGSFHGNGYVISNLYINRPSQNEVGLFGFVNTSTICNVALLDINVTGSDYVGGLVGTNWFGSINNSYAIGNVVGNTYTGGLAGNNYSGNIKNSYATGSVTGVTNLAGGLVGRNYAGRISYSYAASNVNGKYNVGGLVGSSRGSIINSYATGSVTGNTYVGGLVGINYNRTIYSYATGDVTGDGYVGGLAGINYGCIENSYATGNVTGGSVVGGLVGTTNGVINYSYATGAVTGSTAGGLLGHKHPYGIITDCYYNSETTGQSDTGKGEPRTTAQLQDLATFSAWDIVTLDNFNPDALPGGPDFHIWYINQGKDSPRLWWQYKEGGDDNGEEPGDDDFPWSSGFGIGWISDPFNLPALSSMAAFADRPVLGPVPKALVFPSPEGDKPIITANFIKSGTFHDLGGAITLYIKLLQAFEENQAGMTSGEYAKAMVELAVAWAAIQMLDARLLTEAGLNFIAGPQVEAYQAAVEQLAVHGRYLSEAEMQAARAVLGAVAEMIEALGMTM